MRGSRAALGPRTAYELGAPAFFDATAHRYDRVFEDSTPLGHWHRARLDAALQLAGTGPGDVLEAGTGPGRMLEALERRGWTAWGVDISPAMVALARARVPAAAERIQVGTVERLPFASGRFDAAVATGVVEYVDIEAALGALSRVLRPGGLLVVSFRRSCPYRFSRDRVCYPLLESARRIGLTPGPEPPERRLPLGTGRIAMVLARAGLRVEAVEPVGCLVPGGASRTIRNLSLRTVEAAETRRWGRRLLASQLVVSARTYR